MDSYLDRGYYVEIEQDPFPENPRKDYDHLGTMVCWHRRYTLGDEQPRCRPDEYTYEGIPSEDRIQLPLYLYDHSGITMSTQPFSCPWDSGQVGFIWVHQAAIAEAFGFPVGSGWEDTKDGKTLRERVVACLVAEVEVYDYYLTGDVFGVVITKDGEEVENCWGFYGIDSARQHAKEQVEYFLQHESQKEQEEELFHVD